VPGIWYESDGKWLSPPPAVFEDEKALHDLVADAPELLPLSGSPGLHILAREVWLEDVSGAADLVGVEPTGIPVVIEVKLRANSESKRAVVSQILSYAAALHGIGAQDFATLLKCSSVGEIYERVSDATSEIAIDEAAFTNTLSECLADGRFRLVLVLDTVPKELVRLVGFLEQSTKKLLIDLVTVSAHHVGATRVVVPHRVEPEREFVREAEAAAPSLSSKPAYSQSTDAFVEAIPGAAVDAQPALRAFVAWAEGLADSNRARLLTGKGSTYTTLRPVVRGYDAAAVSAWIGPGAPFVLHRTVIEKLAPSVWAGLAAMFELTDPKKTVSLPASALTDEFLALLSAVYSDP
jgi:hypothetical protein